MTKEDFITLINVVEGIVRIEKGYRIISDNSFEGEAGKVYGVWDLIRKYSADRFQPSDDMDEDAERYRKFEEILYSEELTSEEKYHKLVD